MSREHFLYDKKMAQKFELKTSMILFIALFLGYSPLRAQLNPSELSQLKPQQKSIYLQQSAEIKAAIMAAQNDLYKAEDLIKMGNEMKGDNAAAAGAVYVTRGVALKEKAKKALAEAEKEQALLDQAAREGIENNKREAKKDN